VPQIEPFRGIRYRVPDAELGKVLAPPYDVIPPAYQDELYRRDPRNIVRVVLNRTAGDAAYDDAKNAYTTWQKEGLLAPDRDPALYVLEQKFTIEGREMTRRGLLTRFRAEEAEKGNILPHEHTRKEAKEDRYKLLRATRANFSPIFLMLADDDGAVAAKLKAITGGTPTTVYTDDGGVVHRMFAVTDETTVGWLKNAFAKRKAYIADGHHRYATALRYRDETTPDSAWTLGYFAPISDPGMLVQPYHRILSAGPSLDDAKHRLEARFKVAEVKGVTMAAAEVARSKAAYAFALAEPGGRALVCETKDAARDMLPADTPPSLRALDTYFLHRAVLGPILDIPEGAVSYVHSLGEAEEAVTHGTCKFAVLMRGTPVPQIVDVAEARQSMPAKSTFFYPKLPSGLVIHPLVGSAPTA
jgi:uncharacterized protein (DUF1015 family)